LHWFDAASYILAQTKHDTQDQVPASDASYLIHFSQDCPAKLLFFMVARVTLLHWPTSWHIVSQKDVKQFSHDLVVAVEKRNKDDTGPTNV